jgi:putative transposase
VLAAALQASVAAYGEQFVDQVDEHGRRLVVLNGYHHERDVLTAAGAVVERASPVNDRRVDPDTGERLRFPQRSCRRRRRQSRPACAIRHIRRSRLPILI